MAAKGDMEHMEDYDYDKKGDVAVFVEFENIYISVRNKYDVNPNFESIMDKCQEYGRVTIARAYRLSNMYPKGIGKRGTTAPPAELDWDMWLGPRRKVPFNRNIAPYKFRWWKAYSSQVANWGVHYFDAMCMVLGEKAPASVSTHGGQFAIDDDRDIPDTLETIHELATGRLFIFGQYEACGNPAMADKADVELRGTLATAFARGNGFKIVPERGGQFQKDVRQERMERIKVKGTDGDLTVQHTRNFLDCIKSREKPNADVEDGHRSTTMSLLAKISWLTRARLEWDPDREQITNNEEANGMLHYEYRKQWKLG
jgi:hypothetical protein